MKQKLQQISVGSCNNIIHNLQVNKKKLNWFMDKFH